MFEFAHLSISEIEKLISEKESLSIVDFEYIVLLCSLADRYFYINTNLSTAFDLSQKAQKLAKDYNYEYGLALSLIPYCNCLLNFNKTKEAQNAITESIIIFRRISYPKGEALALINYAETLRVYGYYLKAFSELEKSLEIFLSIGEPKGISLAFFTLSKLSLELEDYDAAIEYSQKALSYPNANFSNCRIYNNLGYIYFQKQDYQKSLEFLNKSLYESSLVNDKFCVSNALINLGNVFIAKKEVAKATSYYEQGLSYLSQFGLPINAFSSLKNLANIQIEIGKFDEALNTLNKLKSVAQESNNLYLVDATTIKIASTLHILKSNEEALKLLNNVGERLKNEANTELSYKCHLVFSKIFEEQGNHNEALKHYKIYRKERESFLNTKMREKIKLLGSKSQIDDFLSQRQLKKEKDIELASVYDELVEYNERLDKAKLTISNLLDKLELWKNLIPMCEKCQNSEFKEENFLKVKKNIDENPYLFNQNDTCIACFKSLTVGFFFPNQIYETVEEILIFENAFELVN